MSAFQARPVRRPSRPVATAASCRPCEPWPLRELRLGLTGGPAGGFLLLQDGGYLLQEDGDRLVLEATP